MGIDDDATTAGRTTILRGPAAADGAAATDPGERVGPPAAPDDVPAGELLAGRYRLVRLIGRGGMGQVFEARDVRRNDAPVAIKRMYAADPKGIVRLKREYRRMEGIGHPNLVALHALEEHRERPFIVMEYVEGVDFYAGFGRAPGAPLDAPRLRALVRQLAIGVMALHESGRVHRDLKGSNVRVTPQGRVVVLDFGLVNEVERRTLFTSSMGKVVGTVLYMSPEQAAGQFPGPPGDWYALGVMLHVCVSGRYPHVGGPFEVLWAKQSVDPPRLATLEPATPPELDELVARLLHREPTQRATGLDALAWCDRVASEVRRSAPRPVAARPLIGRQRERTIFQGALDRFLQQRAPLRVDIVGPSGAGKSALLRRFVAPLREDPTFVVLEGRCHEFDSVPFKAFDQVIDALGRYLGHLPDAQLRPLLDEAFVALAQVFPGLLQVPGADAVAAVTRRAVDDDASPQERRLRAFRALRSLLHRVAAGARLVLAVDDLQWGDVDSARLLSELLAPPSAPPLLFVCAYRDEDVAAAPMLRELAALQAVSTRQHEAIVITTEPLAADAAEELARGLLGEAAPVGLAARIAGEAQGNPMLIEALARAQGDDGVPAGLSLEALVDRRLARLDPQATALLEAVAVAGLPIAPELAARAAGLDGDLRAAIAHLRAHRLIRTGSGAGEAVECYHQRIARATLLRLTPEALAERHRRMAAALLEAGRGEPERLVHHWFSAGDLGRAGEAAAEAADLALRTCAFESAARMLEIARRCRPLDPTLRRKLADALVSAGRSAEAAPLLLEASATTSRASVSKRLRREAGEHWMLSGALARGLEVLRPLLSELEVGYPDSETAAAQQLSAQLGRLVRRGLAWAERSAMELPSRELERHDLCWSLCKGHMLVDLARGGLFAAHGALLALELGEPRRIVRSLALVGAVGLERGEVKGREWLKEAERIADKIGDEHGAAFVSLCWGLVHRGRGAWPQALAALERGFALLPAGAAWEQAMASASLMATLEALGELPALALRSQQIAQVAQDLGSRRMYCLGLAYSAWTALAADEPARAERRLREVEAALAEEAFQVVHLHALKVDVDRLLYLGDPPAAWAQVVAAWPALERSSVMKTALRRLMAITLRARAGLALVAAGDPAHAAVLEVVAQDIAQIEREQAVHARAFAGLLRAGVAALDGEDDEVRRHLWTAIADFDGAGMAIHATCARRCLAQWSATAEERAQFAAAETFMRMQGVARPDRWSAVVAPGLERVAP